jgi:hypothetical protein
MGNLTDQEAAELAALKEKCLKKDGSPRKDADPADIARLNVLLEKEGPIEPVEGKIKKVNPADVQAIQVIASLPIIGFDRKDNEIAFDLGDKHLITVGCIRQAKELIDNNLRFEV